MTLYVSVKRAVLVGNNKNKRNDPPYEIRTSKLDQNPQRVHGYEFKGTIRLVYNVHEPLVCGAVCWLEVDDEPVASQPTVINVGVTEAMEIKDL